MIKESPLTLAVGLDVVGLGGPPPPPVNSRYTPSLLLTTLPLKPAANPLITILAGLNDPAIVEH